MRGRVKSHGYRARERRRRESGARSGGGGEKEADYAASVAAFCLAQLRAKIDALRNSAWRVRVSRRARCSEAQANALFDEYFL